MAGLRRASRATGWAIAQVIDQVIARSFAAPRPPSPAPNGWDSVAWGGTHEIIIAALSRGRRRACDPAARDPAVRPCSRAGHGLAEPHRHRERALGAGRELQLLCP